MALPEWCCAEPVPTYICMCKHLYTVDKGLRGQNILQSVVFDWICYLYAQDQFASDQQGSNEPPWCHCTEPSTVEAVNCHRSKTACHWIHFGCVVYTAARPGRVTSQRLKGLRRLHRITLLWQMQKTRDLLTLVQMCGCALLSCCWLLLWYCHTTRLYSHLHRSMGKQGRCTDV